MARYFRVSIVTISQSTRNNSKAILWMDAIDQKYFKFSPRACRLKDH